MTPNITRYVNRTVYVAITGHSEGRCTPYKLLGIDALGLWLDAPLLVKALHVDECASDAAAMTWRLFVPFAQIQCVALASPAPAPVAVPGPATESPDGDSSAAVPSAKPRKPRAR